MSVVIDGPFINEDDVGERYCIRRSGEHPVEGIWLSHNGESKKAKELAEEIADFIKKYGEELTQ